MEISTTTLLMLGLLPVAVWLVLKHPKNSLFMLVATFPMFDIETLNVGAGFFVISPHKVLGLAVVAFMAVDVIARRKEFAFTSPHMLLSVLLLAMLLVSFLVNDTNNLSWGQRYLSNLTFLLVAVTWVEDRREADLLRDVFLYALLVFTVLSMLGLLGNRSAAGGNAMERFDATMLNANLAAQAFVTGLGLALGWTVREPGNPRRRWVGLAMIAFLAWALLATGSRAGLIGMGIALAAAPPLFLARRETRGLLIPFAVAGLLFVAFAPRAMEERIKELPTIEGGRVSIQEEARKTRILQYRLAFELIDERPVTGIGPNEFNRVYSQRVEGDVLRSLHSWYLQVAVDGGIPALILFAGLLLLSAWVWFRGAIGDADPGRRAEAWAQVALVVGLAVFGVVSSVPYAKLTWLVFAYAAVELRVRQMEEKAARFQAGNQAFEEAAAGASPPSDTVVIIRKD